jgi:hypothetical protein
MKDTITRLAAISLLALAAGAAHADDLTGSGSRFLPMKTRAEVRHELMKSIAAGEAVVAGEASGLTPGRTATAAAAAREPIRAEWVKPRHAELERLELPA